MKTSLGKYSLKIPGMVCTLFCPLFASLSIAEGEMIDDGCYSLQRCIAISLDGSYQAREAEISLTRSEFALKDARAEFIPKLYGSVGFVLDDNNDFKFDRDILTGGINISQTIFDGGETLVNYQIAKIRHAINELEVFIARQRIIRDTIDKYFSLALADKKVALLELRLEQDLRKKNAKELEHQKGLISEQELLRSEMDLRQTSLSLLAARQEGEAAEKFLKIAAGISLDTAIQICGFDLIRDSEIEFEEFKNRAMDNSPIMKAAERQTEIPELQRTISKMKRWPRISINAFAGQNPFDPYNTEVSYGLSCNISVPIYTGGVISRSIRSARMDLDRALATFEQFKDVFSLELSVAFDSYSNSRELHMQTEEILKLARKDMELSEKMHALGLAALSDVREAEYLFKQQELECLVARTNFFKATAELHQMMGLLHNYVSGETD